MKKGQISMEYLIIIGLSFAVLLPTAYFFYSYSQTTNENTIRAQVNQLGNELLKNTESVYGLAEGSLITLDVKYPKNIRDIYILGGKELVIRYELSSGMNDAVFFSTIAMSGKYDLNRVACVVPCTDSTFSNISVAEGKHNVKIESKTGYVFITLVS